MRDKRFTALFNVYHFFGHAAVYNHILTGDEGIEVLNSKIIILENINQEETFKKLFEIVQSLYVSKTFF